MGIKVNKQQVRMNSKIEDGDDVEMIIRTEKQSQTGLFTNERLLLIKAGIISYFSSVPKQFIGSYKAIELSKQFPKFTIPADQISKVQLHGNELSFLILKERLIPKAEFYKMVNGDSALLNQRASRIVQANEAGYQQWIFKCNNKDQLEEFYRLVQMFRCGHPKFQPNLINVVEGFQNKPKPRKQTIDPTKNTYQLPKRNSQIPRINNDLAPKEQPKQKPPPQKPIPLEDDPIPFVLEPEPEPKFMNEEQIQEKEEQRLLKLVDKIATNNEPILDTISEKTNQYRNSELSKLTNQRPIAIEVINTFEDSKDNIEDQYIKEQLPQEEQQKEKPEVQQSEYEKESSEEENNAYEPPSNFESRVSFEVRQKRVRKINQLLKAVSLTNKHDLKAMAMQIGLSEEELQQFLNVNSIQEESSWNFIQTELGKILSNKQLTESQFLKRGQIKTVSYGLISDYHKLQQFLDASRMKSGELLEGEISFDKYYNDNSEQFEVLQWMENKINERNPRPFSSTIISKTQYNIHIKTISFNPEHIIAHKNSWIVNQTSPLEQFLAYLSLEKMVKEIFAKKRGNLKLSCGDAIYIKFKEHEAIVKQLKVGYSFVPIKSIRALEFIFRSKDMIKFQQQFPQFIVTVEVIKEGQHYRLHLNRINSVKHKAESIQNELQKLTFTFDNELDIFFEGQEYINLQKRCIETLFEIQKELGCISEQALFDAFSSAYSNLQVDTICKFLGGRIDKENNLTFQPTLMRLGNRQFGEQLALIRKARRKGQIQFSQELSKRVMSRLHYYKEVTPISNFIQIYLQLIDLIIIQKGQLHRAVPVLLKVVSYLSEYEIEQYPVYLALMKTYLKLNELNNFIKVLQNCRLFLSHMFHERALLFDFPFIRILIILAMNEDLNQGMHMNDLLITAIKANNVIKKEIRIKYHSKAIWDKCNILMLLQDYQQAYQQSQNHLIQLQKSQEALHNHWIQGVLCLAKSWLQIEEVNIKNCAIIQKRLERAIELSLARENLQMTFMLLQAGKKVVQRCKELKLPKLLESLPAFEQAKIQFNATKEEMLDLIEQIYEE